MSVLGHPSRHHNPTQPLIWNLFYRRRYIIRLFWLAAQLVILEKKISLKCPYFIHKFIVLFVYLNKCV